MPGKMAGAIKTWWKGLPGWLGAVVVTAVIVLVCIIIVTAAVAGLFYQLTGSNAGSESKSFNPPSYEYIAKIKVIGSIGSSASQYASSDAAYHHAWTLETIDTLIIDENNKGIFLWLNTPGGTVYESDELYLKLMEYKEKTERPVYAYMCSMAASGGYYVASAADEIYANRNTWTGSIGVTLGTQFDVSEFLEEKGIRTETITSGRNKAMGSVFEPLTEEQRAIYQSLVDEAYDQFVGIVADSRGMTDNEAREIADGRIYTAAQALDVKLIDGIMGEKEADEHIKEMVSGTIINCYYKPEKYFSLMGASGGFSIWDLLRGDSGLIGQNNSGNSSKDAAYQGDVAAVLDLAQEQEGIGAPPVYYLYLG